jgi:hypothetical protein
MTELERRTRHEAEVAAFQDAFGASYAAWLDAQPRAARSVWTPVPANDDATIAFDMAANDNLKEAA